METAAEKREIETHMLQAKAKPEKGANQNWRPVTQVLPQPQSSYK